MSERTLRFGQKISLLTLFALLAFVVASAASAASSGSGRAQVQLARTLWMPAVAYRLHADLRPAAATGGSGQFDAVLIQTGPARLRGLAPGSTALSQLGCRVINPPPRSGMPSRIVCNGGPPVAIQTSGVHWLLFWQLGYTGLTGPATARIRQGANPGVAGALHAMLCSGCPARAQGQMTLSPDLARVLVDGNGYAAVQAQNGELRGQILRVGAPIAARLPIRQVNR
jgi:hypothetical protein